MRVIFRIRKKVKVERNKPKRSVRFNDNMNSSSTKLSPPPSSSTIPTKNYKKDELVVTSWCCDTIKRGGTLEFWCWTSSGNVVSRSERYTSNSVENDVRGLCQFGEAKTQSQETSTFDECTISTYGQRHFSNDPDKDTTETQTRVGNNTGIESGIEDGTHHLKSR